MKNKVIFLILTLFLLPGSQVFSQTKHIRLEGIVTDSSDTGIYLVNVYIDNSSEGTFTDKEGRFVLRLAKDGEQHLLIISALNYDSITYSFLADSDKLDLNFQLSESVTSINEVVIRDRRLIESPSMSRLQLKDIIFLPSTGNSIESLLKTMPGVNSPDELSGQYTVRGGSYDENLVYINGMEMYKPQLIKSGRKEGLSIINSDMLGSVYFSSGGFNATYGDKMSSVLDIKYHKPEKFRGSVNLGLLTNTIHAEGISKDKGISIIAGARYMTNRLLLNTLDTEANYTPNFYDLQSLITIRSGANSNLGLFITYGSNNYEFTPLSQRSSFGTFQDAYQLYVHYDGFEQDSYSTFNGALYWEWQKENLETKFTLRTYSADEKESFDIRARYSLNLLDKNIGSDNLGDSVMNVGVGSWLDHARNRLKARVYVASSNSKWTHNNNIFDWGIKFKHELIDDNINEWKMIDSAGYSVPLSSSGLSLYSSVNATNLLASSRLEAYISDNYTLNALSSVYILTLGARFSYWSLNNELLISPRLSLAAHFSDTYTLFFATGIYYQPPFYREMRRSDGSLNRDIQSQKSTHFLLGSVWDFSLGQTLFSFRAEAYYKKLDNIIPYRFDNVRVIYSGENSAVGSAKGIDLRLNGEFVKNAESWISLSLMKATHNIKDDSYGSYPAPGDIRFSADLFFQDYFPSNPSFRAHIKLHYNTGMPVNSPYEERYDRYFRMPAYKRVDMGFTKILKDRFSYLKEGSPLNYFDDIILGFEIFNLLDIKNTISYHWLSTINNLSGEERQFAVPNYLTGRSLNLKLSVNF